MTMTTLRNLTTLTTLLTTLAACGGDALTPKLDHYDIANPVVVVGGSADQHAAAEAAILAMGGSLGDVGSLHVELRIADDPSCRHCLGGVACGASRTVWVCPRLDDMSHRQMARNVWYATAQALWGAPEMGLVCKAGNVIGSAGCGTADDPPMWTAADLSVICSRARGGRCAK